eukprot:9258460-Alexandrium_andersonii.AAC.1
MGARGSGVQFTLPSRSSWRERLSRLREGPRQRLRASTGARRPSREHPSRGGRLAPQPRLG